MIWIIAIGIIAWCIILLFAVSLCKSAFDGDEQIRRMKEDEKR